MNKINKWKKSISTDQYSFRNEYQATIKKKKKKLFTSKSGDEHSYTLFFDSS